MSYQYSLEDLLYLLYPAAPAIVDAISANRRRVEHGLLSVGIKLHCLNDGAQFHDLINELGGANNILEINYYKNQGASLCWVLPPVGSARTAIQLLEAIELATKSKIFDNEKIQIQVCSPGRLSTVRSGMLAIVFYLGSDQIRRYTLGDFSTTFSRFQNASRHDRGKRMVIYDAMGSFDKNFQWWKFPSGVYFVLPDLPFSSERTDILSAQSRLDIQNINLAATLLCHSQEGGFWLRLGLQFEHDLQLLLNRHLLGHLLHVPWVRSAESPADSMVERGDEVFISALKELMSYALDDKARIKRLDYRYFLKETQKDIKGILWDMDALLKSYRATMLKISNLIRRGKPA